MDADRRGLLRKLSLKLSTTAMQDGRVFLAVVLEVAIELLQQLSAKAGKLRTKVVQDSVQRHHVHSQARIGLHLALSEARAGNIDDVGNREGPDDIREDCISLILALREARDRESRDLNQQALLEQPHPLLHATMASHGVGQLHHEDAAELRADYGNAMMNRGRRIGTR